MLKKEDLELYERNCGSQIDLLNMQWILRAKKYYNMKPADIYLLSFRSTINYQPLRSRKWLRLRGSKNYRHW